MSQWINFLLVNIGSPSIVQYNGLSGTPLQMQYLRFSLTSFCKWVEAYTCASISVITSASLQNWNAENKKECWPFLFCKRWYCRDILEVYDCLCCMMLSLASIYLHETVLYCTLYLVLHSWINSVMGDRSAYFLSVYHCFTKGTVAKSKCIGRWQYFSFIAIHELPIQLSFLLPI